MLKKTLLVVITLLTTQLAFSQVSVLLETNRKNYHLYENVYIQLTLQNFSGTPLIFGNAEQLKGSITLEIKKPGDQNSNQSEFVDVDINNMILRPGITEKTQINLGKYFILRDIGKYRIRAIVKHKQLENAYVSNMVQFDASKGFHVWDSTAGVPDLINENPNSKIKSISYKIDSMFDGRDRVYYLTIEDDKNIYTVSRIGQDFGSKPPQCKIDYLSSLHILIQDSSKMFTYLVFEPSGAKVKQQTYKKTKISPYLSVDPDTGKVVVLGGELQPK